MVVGVITGTFDMLHAGHISALRHAAADCDRLVVAVAADELVAALRGVPPVVNAVERAEIVGAVREVHEVVTVDSADLVAIAAAVGAHRVFLTDGEPHPVRTPDSERAVRAAGLDVRRVLVPRPEASPSVRAALGYDDTRTVA